MGGVGTSSRRPRRGRARVLAAAVVVVAVLATAGASPAQAIGPGISVRAALRRQPTGPVLVRGFLVVQRRQVRLCTREVLERRYPCAGASMRVRGLDAGERERLATVSGRRGLRWSEDPVQLLGRVRGPVLRVVSRAVA